jgi:hypothetical protein
VAFFQTETPTFTANPLQVLNIPSSHAPATGMALPGGVWVAVFRKAGRPHLIYISQILISYSLSSFREKSLLKCSPRLTVCAIRRKYLQANTGYLVSKYFFYFHWYVFHIRFDFSANVSYFFLTFSTQNIPFRVKAQGTHFS